MRIIRTNEQKKKKKENTTTFFAVLQRYLRERERKKLRNEQKKRNVKFSSFFDYLTHTHTLRALQRITQEKRWFIQYCRREEKKNCSEKKKKTETIAVRLVFCCVNRNFVHEFVRLNFRFVHRFVDCDLNISMDVQAIDVLLYVVLKREQSVFV